MTEPVIRKVRCKHCKFAAVSEVQADIICNKRWMHFKAGKPRRCEYYLAKPVQPARYLFKDFVAKGKYILRRKTLGELAEINGNKADKGGKNG